MRASTAPALAIAVALASMAAPSRPASADTGNQSFPDAGGYKNVDSIGLITTLGPTGLFQNPTSGIAPMRAFSLESCMGFNENLGDHFQSNGILLNYGMTDWLEVGAFGVFAYGLDPVAVGDSDFQAGNVNARARLVREESGLPEISIGGIASFGDDPLVTHSLYLAASKGFTLNDGHWMKSIRFHGGVRQSWPELGNDITTAFAGVELQVVKSLFLVGEINTEDSDAFTETPWSAGLQYKSSSFGFSAAVMQTPNFSEETYYVGIGVSY
jgi:hypothetical protein